MHQRSLIRTKCEKPVLPSEAALLNQWIAKLSLSGLYTFCWTTPILSAGANGALCFRKLRVNWSSPMWNNYYDACVVWLNPMLSSGLCASFYLNSACLLPTQRLKRTRGRFKCVPPETYCPHMACYFSLPLLVMSLRVSFSLEKFFSH